MKKLFLITASLISFALHASEPVAEYLKALIKPRSLMESERAINDCKMIVRGKYFNNYWEDAKTKEEAIEIIAQEWQELKDCEKQAETRSPEAQSENN